MQTCIQCTDYIEHILRVIAIDHTDEEYEINQSRGTIDHTSFPVRLCDITLPSDCNGYVYMLISFRSNEYSYIGKTNDLHQRLRSD